MLYAKCVMFRVSWCKSLEGSMTPGSYHSIWCGVFQFKQISQAYEVLADPKKREIYDRGGEEAIKGGGSGSGFDFHSPMDIFDMFFGGGGRRQQQGARRGKDVVHQLKVSLEDMYNGSTRKLALQKNVICVKCEGQSGCGCCSGSGLWVWLLWVLKKSKKSAALSCCHWRWDDLCYGWCALVVDSVCVRVKVWLRHLPVCVFDYIVCMMCLSVKSD